MAPLTISPLPLPTFEVQVLHIIFISFGKLLFFQEISQVQLRTLVDGVCIGCVSRNTITFVFVLNYVTLPKCTGATT